MLMKLNHRPARLLGATTVLVLSGCGLITQEPDVVITGSAGQMLAELRVAAPGSMDGYERDSFGWRRLDPDRNGCDSRNDALRAGLTQLQVKPGTRGCKVTAGVLEDPYSGRRVQLPIREYQVDHVVSLAAAYRSGAALWSIQQRRQFSNDPLNLVVTTQEMNRAKADHDAADWLPPNEGYRCVFVARQITVKHRYKLSVTDSERVAMRAVLATCPDQTSAQ